MSIGVQILNSSTKEIVEISKLLGEGSTRTLADANEAEFLAVISALDKLIEMKVFKEKIAIYTDSKLISDMFRYIATPDNKKLRRLCSKIRKRAQKFVNLNIKWIPRKENKLAHTLCHKAFNNLIPEKEKKKKNKKSLQERLDEIEISYLQDNMYIALSSKKDKRYIINLNEYSCTCKYFIYQNSSERQKCKHIIKAEILRNEIENSYKERV